MLSIDLVRTSVGTFFISAASTIILQASQLNAVSFIKSLILISRSNPHSSLYLSMSIVIFPLIDSNASFSSGVSIFFELNEFNQLTIFSFIDSPAEEAASEAASAARAAEAARAAADSEHHQQQQQEQQH